MMHNLPNSRNVARLIKEDWPNADIRVVDESNEVLFIAGHEA